MLKQIRTVLCCALAANIFFGAGSSQAVALTISGSEYTEFLSIETSGNFGYWAQESKYYTGQTVGNTPVNVTSVKFKDPSLNSSDIDAVYAMGTTLFPLGPVITGVVQLKDSSGNNLISAQLKTPGQLDVLPLPGEFGHLGVSGLYDVKGGSLSNLSLLENPIYIQFKFENILDIGYDIKATRGYFHFYRQAGGTGGEPVPEPASMLLLGSGLAGVIRSKRRGAGRSQIDRVS